MKTRAFMGCLIYFIAMLVSGNAWALDEAILTPTNDRPIARLSVAELQKEKADADSEFNSAMSVWFKHRYADGEKLLGEFAKKHQEVFYVSVLLERLLELVVPQ